MHKLYEFACKELKELEDKVDKGLSSAELDYGIKLTELKKNILKVEHLEAGGYSTGHPTYWGYPNQPSYGYNYSGTGINQPTYSYRYDGTGTRMNGNGYMSRYSGMAADDIIRQLEDMRATAPDEMSRREIAGLIDRMRGA